MSIIYVMTPVDNNRLFYVYRDGKFFGGVYSRGTNDPCTRTDVHVVIGYGEFPCPLMQLSSFVPAKAACDYIEKAASLEMRPL